MEKVWVVMGNDYIERVCSSEEAANRVVQECKDDQDRRYGEGAVIYWRCYEYSVVD